MATTMQSKLTDALVKRIEDAGLDAVIQGQYANTGTIFGQRDFDTLVQIRYSFQDSYCSLDFNGPAIARGGLEDSPPIYRYWTEGERKDRLSYPALKYDQGDRIKGMLDLLADLLAAVKTA